MRRPLPKILISLLLGVIFSLCVPASALAISVPDSGPFILQVDIYRHILEDDDMLIHGRYNWPYAALPTETITQAVFVRLLDTDGVTELARNTIYAYNDQGWGYGSFSMYLDASEASGHWGTALTVDLRGSPTLTWTGGSNNFATTTTLIWKASTTQTAARLLAYTHLISWAGTLGDYWSLALTEEYASDTKLSSYGEAYFLNVIPGLRTMIPQLFSGVVETPEYDDIDYVTTGNTEGGNVWPFDFGGLSQYFGLPSDDEVLRTIIAFVIIFIVCALMVKYGMPTGYALFAGFALMFVLAVPGLISRIVVGGVVFLVVLLSGMVFLLRRS